MNSQLPQPDQQPAVDHAFSILIVEDEAMIAMMLEQYLDELGHRVTGIASSLAEAFTLIDDENMDLAILDCKLGSDEIWPVAGLLRERGVSLVFSSGGSASAFPQEFSGYPVLHKPYTIGALAEALVTPSG